MNQSTLPLGDLQSVESSTLAVGEQPQERLESFGASAVSDTELLSIILHGSGTRVPQAVMMASRLISEAGSIAGLISWQAADYRKLKGIGRTKSLQLAALAEIARRMITLHHKAAPLLDRPDVIAAHFAPIVAGLQVEKFWVLCLNRKNRLIKRVEVTSGTATSALAHPREVYREAIRQAATAIVCVHNHPSGDPAPSAPDLHVTRLLREAAKTVDIQLLDHVIIGSATADPTAVWHFSFRAAGLL